MILNKILKEATLPAVWCLKFLHDAQETFDSINRKEYMKKLTYSLALVLTLAFCVHAEIPSEKAASIEKMFQLMGIEKQMSGGFVAMLPMVNQMATQLKLTQEESEELKTIYRDWFKNDIDHIAIKEKMVALYAHTFTTDEINELNKFYSTSVGKKFLEKSPELMKLGAQIGMEEAKKEQAKLMARLQPFLKKHQKQSNQGTHSSADSARSE